MSGPVPNLVEFELAVRHAKLARADRSYARACRAVRLVYDARAAEESARYHEGQVRSIAVLAIGSAQGAHA